MDALSVLIFGTILILEYTEKSYFTNKSS